MEFWGIEVKPEQSYKVHATKLNVLHLSQACLGEVMEEEEEEEEAEAVYVYVKVNDQKLVIGKLSSDKCPQIPLDLVFDKDLELSHSSEDGSIHFAGYKSCLFPEEAFASQGVDGFPLAIRYKGNAARLAAEAADDSDSSDDERMAVDNDYNADSSDEEELTPPMRMAVHSDAYDSSDEEELTPPPMRMAVHSDAYDSSDEEEPTPPPMGKKRPAADANIKATLGNKKARLECPQKSGGAVHQGNEPNSSRLFSCSSCGKAFGTDYALGAHTMAKHVKLGKTPASGGNEPNSSRPFSCSSCGKAFGTCYALQAHTMAKHVK